MRGEYFWACSTYTCFGELPPRARRILAEADLAYRKAGTTSACAENTCLVLVLCLHGGNYLRVRGEYAAMASQAGLMMELPPRARRIHIHHMIAKPFLGTTSACAENTPHHLTNPPRREELPPRARRIPRLRVHPTCGVGTTSACAENTACQSRPAHHSRNYLRVRGEYGGFRRCGDAPRELPPRARRILRDSPTISPRNGTTSACAENTLNELGLL